MEKKQVNFNTLLGVLRSTTSVDTKVSTYLNRSFKLPSVLTAKGIVKWAKAVANNGTICDAPTLMAAASEIINYNTDLAVGEKMADFANLPLPENIRKQVNARHEEYRKFVELGKIAVLEFIKQPIFSEIAEKETAKKAKGKAVETV